MEQLVNKGKTEVSKRAITRKVKSSIIIITGPEEAVMIILFEDRRNELRHLCTETRDSQGGVAR